MQVMQASVYRNLIFQSKKQKFIKNLLEINIQEGKQVEK